MTAFLSIQSIFSYRNVLRCCFGQSRNRRALLPSRAHDGTQYFESTSKAFIASSASKGGPVHTKSLLCVHLYIIKDIRLLSNMILLRP